MRYKSLAESKFPLQITHDLFAGMSLHFHNCQLADEACRSRSELLARGSEPSLAVQHCPTRMHEPGPGQYACVYDIPPPPSLTSGDRRPGAADQSQAVTPERAGLSAGQTRGALDGSDHTSP